jgi:predicted Rossmann-fold nucleotide-binding protein
MAGFSGHQIKNISVFWWTSLGKEREFLESANDLGRVLAERKIERFIKCMREAVLG